MNPVTTVRVELDARGYDIHVGPGLLPRAGALMRPVLKLPRVIVVADATVASATTITRGSFSTGRISAPARGRRPGPTWMS